MESGYFHTCPFSPLIPPITGKIKHKIQIIALTGKSQNILPKSPSAFESAPLAIAAGRLATNAITNIIPKINQVIYQFRIYFPYLLICSEEFLPIAHNTIGMIHPT